MKSNSEKGKTVLLHLESMRSERSSWQTEVETALNLVTPHRARMYVETSDKSYIPSKDRHNATATSSLQLFANGLLGTVCPQKTRWFQTVLENAKANKASGVKNWLQDLDNLFYDLFNKGNFYSNAWQVFYDGGGPGLGSTYIGENLAEQRVDFIPQEPKGSFIQTDSRNRIDTMFIEETITTRNLIRDYGKKVLGEEWMSRNEKKPFERHIIIKAVFPREDRDIMKIDNLNKPFASMHVLKRDGKLLRESGYDSFPFANWRYEYGSGDVYPWSPTLTAQPDVERLNKISRSTTLAGQLAVEPPVWVPNEMYDDFAMTPRFKIRGTDPSRVPKELRSGNGYPIGVDREQYYSEVVKQHYFSHLFLSLMQADDPKRTATEIMQREGEKVTVLGAISSRLQMDYMDNLFDRVFLISARNGWIAPPPEALLEIGGQVKIDYMGTLPMLQKKMAEVQGPMGAMQNFLPLLQVWPEMRHLAKPFEVGHRLLVGGGMPLSDVRDEKQFNQIVQQEQDQANQSQQVEMAEKTASAMQKGGKAPEAGSPAEQLMGGAGV